LNDPKPIKVTTGTSSVDGAALLDSDITKSITLPTSQAKPAWVLYDYGVPQRFRAASLARPKTRSFAWVLEASDDAQTFRKVTELSRDTPYHTTSSFPQVTARFLRLTITPSPPKAVFDYGANAPGAQITAPVSFR
jgi:hypothetical protein